MRLTPMMLLSALLLAGCGERPADPRGVGRDEVLLQVAATGRADTRPDEAPSPWGSTYPPTAGRRPRQQRASSG